jgi:hypothetical protein
MIQRKRPTYEATGGFWPIPIADASARSSAVECIGPMLLTFCFRLPVLSYETS